MKKHLLPFIVLLPLLTNACFDQEIVEITRAPALIPIKNEPVKVGGIDFKNLKAGQKSTYLRGEMHCENGEMIVEHVGDTLILEIIEVHKDSVGQEINPAEIESAFYVKETGWGPNIGFHFATTYPIEIREDKVFLPERESSALFFFYDNDHLDLLPDYQPEHQVSQLGCDLLFNIDNSLFTGAAIVELPSFKVNDFKIEVPALATQSSSVVWKQKVAVACRPVNLLGNGYLMYDQQQLHVSYNYFVSEFNGVISTTGIGFFLADQISF